MTNGWKWQNFHIILLSLADLLPSAQGPKSWPMTLWALRCAEQLDHPPGSSWGYLVDLIAKQWRDSWLPSVFHHTTNINKQPFPCYRWFGKQLGLLVLLSALPQWWQDWQDVPSFLHRRSVSYCAQKKAASGAFSIELIEMRRQMQNPFLQRMSQTWDRFGPCPLLVASKISQSHRSS